MSEIIACGEEHYEALAGIWERSVRASHHFLTEADIAEIKSALIPCYFPAVRLYALVSDDCMRGFIGLCENSIEMLFVDGEERGKGYGSLLMDFAIKAGAVTVDVNEQNPAALEFYLSKGFAVRGRDETDGAGRPFPILHLSQQVS